MNYSHRSPLQYIRFQRILWLLLLLATIAFLPQLVHQTENRWLSVVHAQEPGPMLTIPTGVSAASGESVDVALQFTSNGASVSALIFSIDFDATCLAFDSESNGTGDNVVFQLPAGHNGTATYDADDIDGEIDIAIFSFSSTPAALPDGTLLTLGFETKDTEECQPASGSTLTAEIAFSEEPPLSFSDPDGADIPGVPVDGSVVLNPQPTGEITIVSSVVGEPPEDDWSFVGDLGAFILPPQGGEQVFTDLVVGKYIVQQTARTNYAVNVSCDSGEQGEDEVVVDLGDREAVTCTFVSTFVPPASEFGRITIITEVNGDPPAEPWEYVNNQEAFTLPASGGQITFSELDAGPYVIEQMVKPEYTVSVSCDTGQKGDESVSIDLSSGDESICTFLNVLKPSTPTPLPSDTPLPTVPPTAVPPTAMPTTPPTAVPPTAVPTTVMPTTPPTAVPPTAAATDTPTDTPNATFTPTATDTPTALPSPETTSSPTIVPTLPGQSAPSEELQLYLPFVQR